jgi:hypothetical protein
MAAGGSRERLLILPRPAFTGSQIVHPETLVGAASRHLLGHQAFDEFFNHLGPDPSVL